MVVRGRGAIGRDGCDEAALLPEEVLGSFAVACQY